VCLLVLPSSLCKCNSSEVVGQTSLILNRLIIINTAILIRRFLLEFWDSDIFINFHYSYTLWMQLLWGHWSDSFHIFLPFWFYNFCKSYGTVTFSFNFNIHVVILCEHNSSEVVSPIAIIYDAMIGHNVWSTILFSGA
jgi:hypothetical protein